MIRSLIDLYSILDRSTKHGIAILFVMMGIAAVLELIGISLFIPLFALLSDSNDAQTIPIFVETIGKLGKNDEERIVLIIVIVITFFGIKNLYLGLFTYFQSRFIYNTSARYSRDLLGMYLNRPYTFHLHRNTAELTNNLYGLVGSMFTKTMLPVLQLVLELLTVTGILIVMLLAQPLATLLAASILTLSVTIFYYLVRNKVYIWRQRVTEEDANIFRWINQSIGSVKETILAGHQDYFQAAFARPAFESARYQAFTNTVPSLPRLFIEVIVIAIIMVTILVLLVVRQEPIDSVLPTLGLFGIAAMRIMPAFGKIVTNLTLIKENTVVIDILHEDFTYPGKQQVTESITIDESGIAGEIQFRHELRVENVNYRYPESELSALDDVSVTVPRGKSIAIVGRSGAGKTTLVDVIMGLYAPQKGIVSVDGNDIFANISSWRQRVGYIPQEIYILDDTLRRNIALGIRDDEVDEARIKTAVNLAQLKPVLEQLPDGLETIVGERGTRLSGGQRQRIGIARALYRNPEILVMDEATSALDSETEKDISLAITTLAGDKTVIIIAHRLSTVRDCDLLIMMDQGRVKAIGNFDELANSEPEFLRMIELATIQPEQNDQD